MTTLIRANRVAVKANGENYVADFYRTHKAIASVHSELTDWQKPADANKTLERESFRKWAIEHAEDYNIDWKPQDMRAENNMRRPKYESDQALVDDAIKMLIPEMRALVDKCKYPIEWAGINHEDTVPLETTSTGRDLSTMGIIDGKYEKSGNWAWADINFTVTFKYKNEENYIPVTMQLVSGQLKKNGMGITEFTCKVRQEILGNGLATEEELDPPKEKSSKKSDSKDTEVVNEDAVEAE